MRNRSLLVIFLLCVSLFISGYISPSNVEHNTFSQVDATLDVKLVLESDQSTYMTPIAKNKLNETYSNELQLAKIEPISTPIVDTRTVDDYFNLLPENVRLAFYKDGWTYEKLSESLSEKYSSYGKSILALTVWDEKHIYIDYRNSANKSILHEVGHAFEYSERVKGVYSEEFANLYLNHWEEWYQNYGNHINNYDTIMEAYAQCWEIYILSPECLDPDTRAFIASEMDNI